MKAAFLALLLTSCTSVHVSQGLIDPAFGLHLKPEAYDLSALHTSIQLETTAYENDHIKVDVGLGPSITAPLDGRSPMYGGEVSNRISYKLTRTVQPFVYHSHGMHYHDTEWLTERYQNPVEYFGSDVRYEFSTRIGVGVAWQPTDNLTLDLSYQWTHFSNGKSMFGDKTRQFFHLPTAKTNDGFEAGAVFIGVQYEW